MREPVTTTSFTWPACSAPGLASWAQAPFAPSKAMDKAAALAPPRRSALLVTLDLGWWSRRMAPPSVAERIFPRGAPGAPRGRAKRLKAKFRRPFPDQFASVKLAPEVFCDRNIFANGPSPARSGSGACLAHCSGKIVPFDQDISSPSAYAVLVEAGEGPPPARSPSAGLQRLVRLVKRGGDLIYARTGGLSGFEWRILVEVCAAPGRSINDLGRESDRSVAQVSRTVKRLVALGLLQRVHVPGGQRVAIHPTPLGIEQARQLFAAHLDLDQTLTVGISADELAIFERVVSIMTRNASLSSSSDALLPDGYNSEM